MPEAELQREEETEGGSPGSASAAAAIPAGDGRIVVAVDPGHGGVNPTIGAEDYGSEAYQRIDASVKEILLSELNDDGAYCTLYREMNGIVCIIYSDEGLNNVAYPMSGVFEGSVEAEIYETGELRQVLVDELKNVHK